MRIVLAPLLCLSLTPALVPAADQDGCPARDDRVGDECLPLEEVTIFGAAEEVTDVAGGASLLSNEDLAEFTPTDVVRALRRVPGVSLQVEDGYGLRPNLSIRGTATERSSRITLLEDNVLIAPAPYTAPSAYYFPTFGRIYAMEVLKGPAAVTQGPYTVGGAINLISTPIPEQRSGVLHSEYGSDATWRMHGWYGGGTDRAGFLVETHQWQSNGYQHIDRSAADTGLDKQDYLAKFRFAPNPDATTQHVFELKLQASQERSRQSYLGLTDTDFRRDALRRYGVSERDEMDNEHRQLTATWRIQMESGPELALTGYNNDFERAWYKTEGMDFDGSTNPQSFQRTSWSGIISAINRGEFLGGLDPEELRGILDGADTPEGAIQLRNNSREYYSRGIQLIAEHRIEAGAARHHLVAGVRWHEDEEDRLQRNDNYQQLGGQLVLNERGLEGNAGNRIQDATARAVWIQDRIDWGRWTFAPGLRHESVDLTRIDYDSSSSKPGSRDDESLLGTRSNEVDIWIPGMGLLYEMNDSWRLVAGVHKGFAVPGNKPGVDPEESINYELGVRYLAGNTQIDVMGFFNDYENLVGVCTNSSGSDCEPGDSFNGDGVHVSGLEVSLASELNHDSQWYFPLRLTYTWMDAKFQTDFDSDFFGNVRVGDPVPYVPEHQAWASAGVIRGPLSAYLSVNYVDSVCTRASCGTFERTESATLLDLALHYDLGEHWTLYAVAENLTDELYIAGREPYGARPNKPRTYALGASFSF